MSLDPEDDATPDLEDDTPYEIEHSLCEVGYTFTGTITMEYDSRKIQLLLEKLSPSQKQVLLASLDVIWADFMTMLMGGAH